MNLFHRKTRVLLVCTENICRSPMAEGLLRHYLAQTPWGDQIQVNSAGTVVNQPGRKPDPRAYKIAARVGVSLAGIRAKRIAERDIERHEMIIGMDNTHMQALQAMSPAAFNTKCSLLLSFSRRSTLSEVPDPYYGSTEGFNEVFSVIDEAVHGLLAHLAEGRV